MWRGLGWEELFHPPAPTSGGKRGWEERMLGRLQG